MKREVFPGGGDALVDRLKLILFPLYTKSSRNWCPEQLEEERRVSQLREEATSIQHRKLTKTIKSRRDEKSR